MNMLTLAILFILFIGAYSGYRNGIVIGLVRTIGYTISLILAFDYYKLLSEFIYLIIPYPSPFAPTDNPYSYYEMDMIFTLDQSYYYLISFLLIVMVGWLITRLISQFINNFTEKLTVPEPFDGIGGALIGFIFNYLTIFLFLLIASTIPYDLVQNKLSESVLADNILTNSPVLSKKSYQHFILDVHEEEIKKLPTMELEELREKVEPEENEENDE